MEELAVKVKEAEAKGVFDEPGRLSWKEMDLVLMDLVRGGFCGRE